MIRDQLKPAEQQFVQHFSEFVNGQMSSAQRVGAALTHDHRYLVSEKMKLALMFMEQLAHDYYRGCYDERNECACRLSASILGYLVDTGQYDPCMRTQDK